MAAGTSEFQNASKLLTAARRGDIQTVQFLINNGVDVNYTDATGLSLVCTAVMNNDKRAIQILQMYGADASNCDRQIRQYKQKSNVAANGEETGFFSGLSSTHVLTLSAVGAAAVIGGVVLLANAFDNDGGHGSSGSSGDRPNHNDGDGSSSSTTQLFAQDLPNGPGCNSGDCSEDFDRLENWQDFDHMSTGGFFNYLMVARAYDAFVRGYFGANTIRINSDKSPFDLSQLPYVEDPNNPGEKISVIGGAPINVAMITASGVNATGSAADGLFPWIDVGQIVNVQSICQANGQNSDVCQTALATATNVAHKYYNYSGASAAETENTSFNLSGSGSVFGSATDSDTTLAKIIAGWEAGGREDIGGQADLYGFIPNGQLTAYKVGVGATGVADYKNYAAIYDALTLKDSGEYVSNVVANLSLPTESSALDYATVNDAKILYNASSTDALKKSVYLGTIDNYYNLNTTDDDTVNKPSIDANNAFTYLGNYQKQILVNSAGRTLHGLGTGKSLSPQVATFENFAPVVYNNLQNLFMTVVAVKPKDGTSEENITGYTHAGAGTLELSTWDVGTDSYTSRICGLSGTGNGGAMNPWCFAAPGNTDMEATASMAGSVALVSSAFNYMTPQQVFLLLALTSDGPYLGINPETNLAWASESELITYLRTMYTLPGSLDSSDSQYLESFKNAFGYGMINLERATRPGTNVYFYDSDTDSVISANGKNAYWGKKALSSNSSRATALLSLTNRAAITTSFYDVIESADGSVSLPRVWNVALGQNDNSKHGLYMGDVLGEFNVDSTNKRYSEIGNFAFDMAMSARAYNDNLSGLDNLRVAFRNEDYDLDASYQRFLVDGQSRFDGRANGVLSLVSDSITTGAKYKYGNFAFGGRAFSGAITDENLLEKDPVISSQFEPGRLGLANGGEAVAEYNNDTFAFNVAVGNLHETNTVLGAYNDGLLTLRGGNTQYVDAVAEYKLFDVVKLFGRATFANTRVDEFGGIISNVSDIKSNAFALGADIGGFNFTVAQPLAIVDGKMGYDYAEFNVVENDNGYEIAMNNPHVEYVDLSAQKRELRFSTSYKKSIGEFTDAGLGMIYRVHPNNTDVFENESIFMFKLHHRLGI